MAEKTVTIGDTEVELRETEDGFEAVEKRKRVPSGVYLRGESSGDRSEYGFMIPITADFVIEEVVHDVDYTHRAAFNKDDNVDDDLILVGGAADLAQEHGFDGHVNVDSLEIVEC